MFVRTSGVSRPRIRAARLPNCIIGGLLSGFLVCSSAASSEPRYALCPPAKDPPACLVGAAILQGGQEPSDVVEAVVATGSVELVEAHPATMIRGARSVGAREPARVKASSRGAAVGLAAVALAAAAQRSDDPMHDPIVNRLIKAARADPAIERIAVGLWNDIDDGSPETWLGDQLRPRGLGKVWDAIVANPPADSEAVAELGTTAASLGFRDKGLNLFRIVAARTRASSNAKAHAASDLARLYDDADLAERLLAAGGDKAQGYDVPGIRIEIAEARLRHGYDAAAASAVVRAEEAEPAGEPNYTQGGDNEALTALEAANAHVELERLGGLYLARAHGPDFRPEYRGDWFALASDAYRRAGDLPAAIASARAGLPQVPPAIAERTIHQTSQGDRPEDRNKLAVEANGYGAAPVLALYRAGQRGEALRFGYIKPTDRFERAKEAGEEPDPTWVVDGASFGELENLVVLMVQESDRASAATLLDPLGSARSRFQDAAADDWERQLGLIAALAGRQRPMIEHFARSALALDAMGPSKDDRNAAGYFALALAVDWRKGEIMEAGRAPAAPR